MPETFPTSMTATTTENTTRKQEEGGGSKARAAGAKGKQISYADAGVDISAADKSKHRIKMLAR